jgi:hypothetical protein
MDDDDDDDDENVTRYIRKTDQCLSWSRVTNQCLRSA